MEKIKILGFPFRLHGKPISKNQHLSFKAVNRLKQVVYLDDFKGPKVVSIFPNINTRVCGIQTQKIALYAQKYPKVLFISITTDPISKINKWCLAKGIDNIEIWTDEYLDFANKTNLLINRAKRLTRALLVLDAHNKVMEIDLVKNLAHQVNFALIDKVFAKNKK